MKKILLTIDTEFIISKEEILGIDGSNGLEDILSILKEHEVKATFFIDYYENKKWGDEVFKWVTKQIIKEGHQIELHLHPGILGDFGYMWQYTKEQQYDLLEESIKIFNKYNSKPPKFFRAGGYSANNDTLDILKSLNFIADLSFQYRQKRCKINNALSINKIHEINDLVQIPTTVYKYWFIKERYNSINFEWSSLSELKEISKQIENSKANFFVIMMHSFSLLKRWDRKRLTKNNSQKNKFRKYLAFAKQQGFQFVTVDELSNDYKENKDVYSTDFVPYISNPFIILTGLIEKIKMKYVLNRKFRYQFISGLLFSILSLFLLLYISCFNYISPGYNAMKNVTVITNTWNADNDISSIENYFIELDGYKNSVVPLADNKGILYRKPYTDTKKYLLSPTTDSLYIATDMSGQIIKEYTKFIKTNDSIHFNKIILYSDWLKDNAVVHSDFVVWPYDYKFTKYNLDFGWCGSWALGNILSGLARRIELTQDVSFIQLGNKAISTFDTPIEEGGILYIDNNKNYWYEEYPSIPPSRVLNGHINGLLGLYDFWRVTKSSRAKELFDKGIKTLEYNLKDYDSGYWSYYDNQYSYVADYYYHKAVHIPQLKILYQITNKEIFKEYADLWEKYLNEPNYTRYKLKMIYDGLHRRFTYKSFFTWGK